jgi:lysyl-tRNA synthetase class II
MHGISDPELQRRYRYADLIASSLQIEHEGLTTREVFERRAKLISGMRRFLTTRFYRSRNADADAESDGRGGETV